MRRAAIFEIEKVRVDPDEAINFHRDESTAAIAHYSECVASAPPQYQQLQILFVALMISGSEVTPEAIEVMADATSACRFNVSSDCQQNKSARQLETHYRSQARLTLCP